MFVISLAPVSGRRKRALETRAGREKRGEGELCGEFQAAIYWDA
jgi:hypothetical protein